jgi:hypothetical protein
MTGKKRKSTKEKKAKSTIDLEIESIQNILKELPVTVANDLSFHHKKLKESTKTDRINILTRDLKVIEEKAIEYQRKLYKLKEINGLIHEDVSQNTYPFPLPCYNEVDEDSFPVTKWVKNCVVHKEVQVVDIDLPGCDCSPTCTDSSQCSCAKEMNRKRNFINLV